MTTTAFVGVVPWWCGCFLYECYERSILSLGRPTYDNPDEVHNPSIPPGSQPINKAKHTYMHCTTHNAKQCAHAHKQSI